MRVFSFLSVKVLPRRAACAALFACILALPPSALAGPIRQKRHSLRSGQTCCAV